MGIYIITKIVLDAVRNLEKIKMPMLIYDIEELPKKLYVRVKAVKNDLEGGVVCPGN